MQRRLVLFVLAALAAVLPSPVRAAKLTQAEAELRARQLSGVSYRVELSLDPARPDFDGTATLRFDLKPGASGDGVFVELADAKIRALELNGIAQTPAQTAARYDGRRIRIQPAELKRSGNRIVVTYSRAYVNNGNGLHRFRDIADGRLYHFNHFEAYYAHLVFPCFDQPDIKAPITLKVDAPADWEVIASTTAQTTQQGEIKSWAFAPTPAISTYVLTIAAGPFRIWSGQAGRTPLRLLARQSVAQYVDPEEWLTVTAQALDFYAKEFSYPYPFTKLDLILVPDFPAGATENLAGITLGELETVFRSRQPLSAYVQRASILTHEIAHMWFGDLVTMKWWNGLWLNESFASFMEALSLAEATRYRDDTWLYFHSRYKRRGYREDQLVTTHPIDGPVADTDRARASFDSITYGKGASVLKQLRYLLGADAFRRGLASYFKKHAYGNTALEDFIGALSSAAGTDLTQWQALWLRTTGPNTVRARWACSDGKIASFSLVQSAPAEHPTLRPHRTEIGLYVLEGSAGLRVRSILNASYSGAETPVPQAVGKPCPALVFPNQNDQDFVKVDLDPVSLATVRAQLGRVADRLGRQMLWWTLLDMVRDARLAPAAFVEAVVQHLDGEQDPQIVLDVLRMVSRDVVRYIPPARRGALRARLETFLRAQLDGSKPGSDRQILFYTAYLGAVVSPAAAVQLRDLLLGKASLPGLAITQDRRWGLVQALCRLGEKDAAQLIAAERERDPTDEGHKGAIAAEAQIPDAASKTRWFQRITRTAQSAADNAYAMGNLREAMTQFQILGQEALLAPLVDRYFDALVRLAAQGEDNMYLEHMTSAMYPVTCDPEIVAKTTAFLDAHPNLPAGVIKSLRIRRQEAEICLKIQAL